jgi:hypothetical protein
MAAAPPQQLVHPAELRQRELAITIDVQKSHQTVSEGFKASG